MHTVCIQYAYWYHIAGMHINMQTGMHTKNMHIDIVCITNCNFLLLAEIRQMREILIDRGDIVDTSHLSIDQ